MNRNYDECGRAIAEGDKITKGDDVEMIVADPVNFIAYCGLYCNACRIRQGKVKEAVTDLRDIIASFGIEKSMPSLQCALGLMLVTQDYKVKEGEDSNCLTASYMI